MTQRIRKIVLVAEDCVLDDGHLTIDEWYGAIDHEPDCECEQCEVVRNDVAQRWGETHCPPNEFGVTPQDMEEFALRNMERGTAPGYWF